MCLILHIRKQTSIVSPSICHAVYEILNGDTGYRVTWNERNGSNSPPKCEKIVIHLFATDESSEDQLVAITIFVPTGRFLIQGKLYEEWSLSELPILLYTVDSIQYLDMLDTSKNKLLFASPMSTFFKNFIYFVSDDSIPTSSAETASNNVYWTPPELTYSQSLNLSHSLQID